MWLTGRSKEVDEDRQQANISVTLLQWLLHHLKNVQQTKKWTLESGSHVPRGRLLSSLHSDDAGVRKAFINPFDHYLSNDLDPFCTLVLNWLPPHVESRLERLWPAELAICQFNTSFSWAEHPNDDWLPTGAFDIEQADQWRWRWTDWQQWLFWISVSQAAIKCGVKVPAVRCF